MKQKQSANQSTYHMLDQATSINITSTAPTTPRQHQQHSYLDDGIGVGGGDITSTTNTSADSMSDEAASITVTSSGRQLLQQPRMQRSQQQQQQRHRSPSNKTEATSATVDSGLGGGADTLEKQFIQARLIKSSTPNLEQPSTANRFGRAAKNFVPPFTTSSYDKLMNTTLTTTDTDDDQDINSKRLLTNKVLKSTKILKPLLDLLWFPSMINELELTILFQFLRVKYSKKYFAFLKNSGKFAKFSKKNIFSFYSNLFTNYNKKFLNCNCV